MESEVEPSSDEMDYKHNAGDVVMPRSPVLSAHQSEPEFRSPCSDSSQLSELSDRLFHRYARDIMPLNFDDDDSDAEPVPSAHAAFLGQVQLQHRRKKMPAYVDARDDWSCCKRRNCYGLIRQDLTAIALFRKTVFTVGSKSCNRGKGLSEALKELAWRRDPCKTCLCQILSCSRAFLYSSGVKDKGDSNRKRGSKQEHILAWFQLLMPILDQMPDESWYQVSAPDRTTVAKWYQEDCKLYPSIFESASVSLVLLVWREY